MGIEEVVSVSISVQDASVSQQGFGTGMLAAYHTHYLDRIRSYSGIAGMVTDGFSATGPHVRAATKYFAQTPHPPILKVGRRASAFTQIFTLTPTDTTVGLVYTLNFVLLNGTISKVTYTVVTSDTVALIIAGLITAMAAASPAVAMTTSNHTTYFTLTANAAGALFDLTVNPELTLLDSTADPGISADLTAIALADADWFGLALDSNGIAEITAAALWASSQTVIFAYNSADTVCATSSTADVGSVMKGLGYTNVIGMFSESVLSFAGLAWLAEELPKIPGTSDWAYKNLPGVAVDVLNPTQKGYLKGKNLNYYTALGGRNITRWGTAASGRFIDITHFVFFLTARMQEEVYATIVSLPKVPFTDSGVGLIKAAMLGVMLGDEIDGSLVKGSSTVSAPLVASISPTDRANRALNGVTFATKYTGAVNTAAIQGTLSI